MCVEELEVSRALDVGMLRHVALYFVVSYRLRQARTWQFGVCGEGWMRTRQKRLLHLEEENVDWIYKMLLE